MKKSLVLIVSGILALIVNAIQAAPHADAKIINLDGIVSIYPAGDKASVKPLKVGEALMQGDVVTTDRKSTAKIVFANGATIDLKPDTQVLMEMLSQELDEVRDPDPSVVILSLRYGSLDGEIKKLSDRSKFYIKTPQCIAIPSDESRFSASNDYNPISNSFDFFVNNVAGSIDILTHYEDGNVYYNSAKSAKNMISTNVNSKIVKIPVPEGRTIIFTALRDTAVDYWDKLHITTPDRSEVVIVSPLTHT